MSCSDNLLTQSILSENDLQSCLVKLVLLLLLLLSHDFTGFLTMLVALIDYQLIKSASI